MYSADCKLQANSKGLLQYIKKDSVDFIFFFLPQTQLHCIHLHSKNKWRGRPTAQLAVGVQKGGGGGGVWLH